MIAERLIEAGMLPDTLIRMGIRQRLKDKLKEEKSRADLNLHKNNFFKELKQSSIAIHTDAANDQHYELPPQFFKSVLGKHLKYSCGYWDESTKDLNRAERKMLDLYIERSGVEDGQSILDLGCGWGSFSLYAAERFKKSHFLAVSNSNPQREYIESQVRERGLKNLRVITRDVNELVLEEKFDRVISIEMFEHMRNYKELLHRIAGWLKEDGALFVHIFCHKDFIYPFTHDKKNDWMGRYFFTGGIMPSLDLFDAFREDLEVEQRWVISGKHYERTANAWLKKMDRQKKQLQSLFKETYGSEAGKWWNYWRVFFMACAELFGYSSGREWCVGHYLLRRIKV